MKKKKKLIVLNNFKLKKNFILSALNLAFISYLLSNKINITKNFYLWNDGIFGKLFKNIKKTPGYELLKLLSINKFKEILVIGNSNKKDINYLKKIFKTKIKTLKLPQVTYEEIKKLDIFIKKNTLIIITLPTPKQEILANRIVVINKFYKIVCIGGGLGIASGNIKKCPKILSVLGLEAFWRLRTDTIRRLNRLIASILISLYYLILTNKIKQYLFIKANDKS